MNIDSIRIRNFRSLRLADLDCRRLNIFVGKNDSGKSNVLRALDMFFNHGGDYPFDWKTDFCSFAPKQKNKAPEIEIQLVISPPSNFKDQRAVRWRKAWRGDGFHSVGEKLRHLDGAEIDPKNKFGALLKGARFDYVPAIKDQSYFGKLLGAVHDMLERTVEEEIRTASREFMSAINEHTGPITEDLMARLHLESSIQLPPDLRDLFAQLDFRSRIGDHEYSLIQRGDGIKVRHIPVILKWLATQARTLAAPGRPAVSTTWGYEEPENNLEMGRCGELAEEFLEDSNEIQTFISTHSPAFYSVFQKDEEDRVALFGVRKEEFDEQESSVRPLSHDDLLNLDDSMGLMPLVAPYYESALGELRQIKANRADLPETDRPVLFVEGTTDETILAKATEVLFPVRCPRSLEQFL